MDRVVPEMCAFPSASAGVTLGKTNEESQTEFWHHPEARLRPVRFGAVFAGS